MAKPKNIEFSITKRLPWILIICGIIAFSMAYILMQEKMSILKNPSYTPICNINPVIACGSVINSNESSAFGFPNPILGIAGFAIVATTGVLMLAGAQKSLKPWFWRAFQGGMVFALLFIHWLIYSSLYSIGSLCPFCMVTWVVTAILFWYVTLYNLQNGHIKLSKRFDRAVAFAYRHHVDIAILWILIITALILNRFWYYWSTVL